LLGLNQRLFGITFQKVEGAPVWHDSVDAYDVLDGSEVIARFYLDMHPRDGKYGHAAAFGMYSGAAGLQLPSASLVCNFPDPSDGGPALMEHRDVVTFFHEFGHLMHHLLSGKHRWVTFSAFNVEWDFVETPSQLMEEWAWSPDVLQQFAIHHVTKKPIAAELVRKMRAADEFGKGVHVTRQMYLAALALAYYSQDPAKLDLLGVIEELRGKYSPFPYEKGSHFFANFGHLEGYSSTYYTYMWSLVLVKDVFTKFAQAGMMHTPTAQAYRQAVLSAGASQNATDMVTAFLGRPYAFDAFKSWLERE
jgi:thimet oligopeptidase